MTLVISHGVATSALDTQALEVQSCQGEGEGPGGSRVCQEGVL